MSIKTKPFDLEKALAGAKVVTRDGQEVEHLAYFDKLNSAYKIYVLIKGGVYSVTVTGAYSAGNANPKDLFLLDETPEIKVGDKVYVSDSTDIYEVIAKYKTSDVYIVESANGELIKFKASGLKIYKPEPAKLSGFINVYPRKSSNAWMHETKERADEDAGEDRIACIDLSQFEVGHGLKT